MPDAKLRDKISGESAAALRKIVASKGKIQGNFYFAGDAAATDAGVVITLSSRDPKGAKAVALGKKLRKDVPKSKFARGTVRIKDNKLVFELSAGTASSGMIKNGFKKNVCKLDGLKLLSRAVIRAAGGDVTETPETPEAPEPADAALTDIDFDTLLGTLSDDEKAELETLGKEQEALDQGNSQLLEAFTSEADDEEILAQTVTASLDTLTELQKVNPLDLAKIQEERFKLAESLYIGDDPFPAPGGDLDEAMSAVLSAATDDAIKVLQDKHAAIAAEISTAREELAKMPDGTEKAQRAQELVNELEPKMRAMRAYLVQIENLTVTSSSSSSTTTV